MLRVNVQLISFPRTIDIRLRIAGLSEDFKENIILLSSSVVFDESANPAAKKSAQRDLRNKDWMKL